MIEKDVNLFVMLKKIMQSPTIITVARNDVSCEVTQLYNRQILAWSSYGTIYDNISDDRYHNLTDEEKQHMN